MDAGRVLFASYQMDRMDSAAFLVIRPQSRRWSIGIDPTSWRGQNVRRPKRLYGFGIRN